MKGWGPKGETILWDGDQKVQIWGGCYNDEGKHAWNVECVRETEILVGQQPPKGVSICDHAGRAINDIAHWGGCYDDEGKHPLGWVFR